jgi:hypothetical protein
MNGTDGFLDIHDSHLRVLDGNIHAKSIILDQLDITSSNTTSSTVQFLNGDTAFKTTANVEIGTANLFVDTSTSNVGILTSTPTHTLDVRGTANVEVLRTSSNIEMNGGTFSLGGHMIPSVDNQYDIGSAENKIRDMYVSDNSLWIGDKAKISFDDTEDKLTFRKRKASDTFIPAKIIDLANASGEGLNTTISITNHILEKSYTPSRLGAMKLHHWLRYAKDFQSNIKLSEIFANTESDFDSTSTAEGTFSGTGALTVPSGTTAQQPTGVAGMIRFNTTVNELQVYNGTIWKIVGGMNATGGTITDIGGYRIHMFTSDGTFTLISGGDVDYLVVAGGGGGGAANTTPSADNPGAGGGGAGGVLTGNISLNSGSYIITCGTGGSVSTGSTSPANGNKGGNSSIASLIVAEGGGGGGKGVDKNTGPSGGCGGGGGGVVATGSSSGGSGTIGFDGGISTGANSGGGGGGGMGSVGSAGSTGGAGNGGNGIESNISGTNTYYAAGGGGGRGDGNTGPGGTGGTGGGGNGGGNGNQATAGTPFTGSGGGGGKDAALPISTGASGGSGVVIIRYRI